MKELFDLSFSAANIIPTGLFVFILLYWLTVLLGFFDFDSFDFDIDVDVDTDIEVEAEAGNPEGGTAWLNHILAFFNLGKIPFMVWLSFVTIPLWVISIITNAFFRNETFVTGIIFLIPALIITLLLAKILTTPFVRIFEAMDKENKPKELTGKICQIIIPPSGKSKGQADINYDGSPIRIYVIADENSLFSKGDDALVIEKKDNVYFIEPYKL